MLFGDEDGVLGLVLWEMPSVPSVRIRMEEHWDATREHGVKDGTPRGGVALGLQAEHRLFEEAHHGLGRLARAFVTAQELAQRRAAALINDLAAN